MNDLVRKNASQMLLREIGLDDANIARRRKIVGLEASTLPRIEAIKDLVTKNVDEYVAAFFNHLASLDEGRPLFTNQAILQTARQLKRKHLVAMVQGEYGMEYVEQRLELGSLYAKVGLDTRVFLGAFHMLLKQIGDTIMEQFQQTPIDGFENFMALEKVAFFDIGIIIDIMVPEREHVIRQQQEAIRKLSTPVLQVGKQLLLVPIIGVIDAYRGGQITESLLQAIRANKAKVVVMDVTGVVVIDSRMAHHLLQTVEAARLMGTLVIVTGLTSDIAQSLVALGIDLSRLNIKGDLQGGLDEAARILGNR